MIEKLTHSESLEDLRPELEIVLSFLAPNTPEQELEPADAIFIFGHYDPRVAHHAAHLWTIGKAQKIIITGKGEKNPEQFTTEADHYTAILEEAGVPREDMVLEKEATNTLENALYGIKAAQDAGLQLHSLILCCFPFLLRRSLATFQKQFPAIKIQGSVFERPLSEWLTRIRSSRFLGEFDRFTKYSTSGNIASVDVPPAVALAVEKLRKTFAS